MKRFNLTLIFAILAITNLSAKDKADDSQELAEITFAEIVHDFGYIPEDGGLVTYEFKFTNTGNAPLVIINAQSSCGCTIPEYTTKPIKAGKSSEIKVSYNPNKRPGAFKKAIRISTNTPKQYTTLNIIGSVIPAKKAEK